MTAQEMLKSLVEFGLTQTQIATAIGTYQPILSKMLCGSQKDLTYEVGKRLEDLYREQTAERRRADRRGSQAA